MPSFRALLYTLLHSCLLGLAASLLLASTTLNAAAQEPANSQPITPSPASQSQPQPPLYDPAPFQKPIPSDQLIFLGQFAGVPAKEVMHDKQFRKLMHNFVPDCIFHYGRDMSLGDALDMVLKDSKVPVVIRDERYVTISGADGPYLGGRGFLWIDIKTGIALGGFYFHPTNGEPTPSLVIFSREIKEDTLSMGQLPQDFAIDLSLWSSAFRVSPITTRYFITGSDKRILLQHDEDYCISATGTAPPPKDVCEQMNSDAADLDMNAAIYLDQTHHATNATAWMINDPTQIAWLQVRDNTCGAGPDPLGCRIVMTHRRTEVILHPHPAPHPIHR
jgi:uncharacterized protein YecT (DUF1311 family)